MPCVFHSFEVGVPSRCAEWNVFKTSLGKGINTASDQTSPGSVAVNLVINESIGTADNDAIRSHGSIAPIPKTVRPHRRLTALFWLRKYWFIALCVFENRARFHSQNPGIWT